MGKFPVGNKKECVVIHPQLCWPFLRHGHGEYGCQHGAACGQLHPRICQESWRTGKCDEEGTCRDGYHLGKGPGKPRTRSHYGTPRRQRKRASRRVAENSAETDKVTKGEQDSTKGLTIQVNNTVTTQAENLKELDGQARKMDSPKESQNNSRPRPSETASMLSNWSLGFMIAIICFIATIVVVLISFPKTIMKYSTPGLGNDIIQNNISISKTELEETGQNKFRRLRSACQR